MAHLPPGLMVSTVDRPAEGESHVNDIMIHVQGKAVETPTILPSWAVRGKEEVPVGVQAGQAQGVASAPDALSHCGGRAQNSRCLLALGFDAPITEQVGRELAGQWVKIHCEQGGTVSVERQAADLGPYIGAQAVAFLPCRCAGWGCSTSRRRRSWSA